jgi:dimethylamine monooxygenase subunit A
MSLSELLPDEDYRFHLGLRRGAVAELFVPTVHHGTLVAERRRWLGDEPETYSALWPECIPLLDECIEFAKDWQTISVTNHDRLTALKTPRERCVELGAMWEPDFLLLKADATGSHVLLGGCVCFPSSWRLADKVGRPIEFIHGVVPGLNPQIGRSIQSFLSKLTPKTAWLRHNWGLSRSSELNQHPSRALAQLDESVTPQDVWLRVEDQALVRLPKSGGILFGIRVTMHSLVEVQEDPVVAKRLARALETMPETVASYKGLATARQRIVELLTAREQ